MDGINYFIAKDLVSDDNDSKFYQLGLNIATLYHNIHYVPEILPLNSVVITQCGDGRIIKPLVDTKREWCFIHDYSQAYLDYVNLDKVTKVFTFGNNAKQINKRNIKTFSSYPINYNYHKLPRTNSIIIVGEYNEDADRFCLDIIKKVSIKNAKILLCLYTNNCCNDEYLTILVDKLKTYDYEVELYSNLSLEMLFFYMRISGYLIHYGTTDYGMLGAYCNLMHIKENVPYYSNMEYNIPTDLDTFINEVL